MAGGAGAGHIALMRQLTVFNTVSLDGYFADAAGDMSWAHATDPEWTAFTAENAGGGAELVFGRITYQMMAGFWPTPAAMAALPSVAEAMNRLPKVVFSRTLERAEWNNTRLFRDDLAATVRRLKAEPGPDLLILGSGRLVAQLTQEGLIDAFQIVVKPIVLGAGRTMFADVTARPLLRLTRTRSFGNGNVVLWYER